MSHSLADDFWVGQLLELETHDHKTYFTQILKTEQYLQIQRPKMQTGVPMTVDTGMNITVNFYDEQKGMSTFNSRLIQLPNGHLIIKKPNKDDIKKIQRRRFFRVDVATNMTLFISQADNSKEDLELNVYTHDLSGGGVSFLAENKTIEIGTTVTGVLFIKKNKAPLEISFKANVVNVMKQESHFYKISLQFIDMTEKEQSDIVGYCIYKQVENRNKLGKV